MKLAEAMVKALTTHGPADAEDVLIGLRSADDHEYYAVILALAETYPHRIDEVRKLYEYTNSQRRTKRDY